MIDGVRTLVAILVEEKDGCTCTCVYEHVIRCTGEQQLLRPFVWLPCTRSTDIEVACSSGERRLCPCVSLGGSVGRASAQYVVCRVFKSRLRQLIIL